MKKGRKEKRHIKKERVKEKRGRDRRKEERERQDERRERERERMRVGEKKKFRIGFCFHQPKPQNKLFFQNFQLN
jgi:hypothetical protein